ncbi:MAG TPA: glycosyltransferase family 2 protein, partial [Anaerolineae bacterium]|nr:glycosyltransferase family 2 protein [Anaerolineae bacterium]
MSPSSEPLVSFIIPSYNHANFIGECLESILNQTATQDWEIVLVDDASPDETDRVVQAFRDPRIRYTRHPQNRGLIATLNTAVALARGRYIARQDSDNRYRPDFLEQ